MCGACRCSTSCSRQSSRCSVCRAHGSRDSRLDIESGSSGIFSSMKIEATTPVLLVGDIAATTVWYRTNLAFDGRAVPDNPPHSFGIIARDGVEIFLQQLAGYMQPDLYDRRDGGVWHVYVRVSGVRELYESVSRAPAVTLVYKLRRQPYGQLEFAVRDPNGYVLVFAEPISEERRMTVPATPHVDCERQHPILAVADVVSAADFYTRR